jgi:hypothetical protein
MGNLRHPIAMFIMAILVVIGIGVGVLAATMPPSGPTYSLKVLVADVNVLYKSYGSSPPYVDFRLVPSRPVPLSEAAAARKAITVCNEGRGTQVIAAGLVRLARLPGRSSWTRQGSTLPRQRSLCPSLKSSTGMRALRQCSTARKCSVPSAERPTCPRFRSWGQRVRNGVRWG